MRSLSTYVIPYKLHGPRAKTKAEIVYDYGICVPVTVGAVIVRATTHAEAYRRLCHAIRPSDPRPIMGRSLIRFFRESWPAAVPVD